MKHSFIYKGEFLLCDFFFTDLVQYVRFRSPQTMTGFCTMINNAVISAEVRPQSKVTVILTINGEKDHDVILTK